MRGWWVLEKRVKGQWLSHRSYLTKALAEAAKAAVAKLEHVEEVRVSLR